jgi:hypothetical protein
LPDLLPGCGADALKVASGGPGLMLVVDDLSRAEAPANLLVHLASWARRQASGEEGPREIAASGWFLLCPIWPRFLSQLSETAREVVQSQCLHGGTFTPEEGTSVLQARGQSRGVLLTEMEARRLCADMGLEVPYSGFRTLPR